MIFRQAILSFNGKSEQLHPGKTNSFEELYVNFNTEEMHGGQHWSLFIHPKQDIVIQKLEISFDMNLPAGTRFFANGYQSWSESRLYKLDEGISPIRKAARPYFGFSGDDRIQNIPRKKGHLHSWSYTYFKKPGSTLLVGSTSERSGFTLFLFDKSTNTLTIRKDLDKLALSHSFPALDFWMGESTEADVFDSWFAAMGLDKKTSPVQLGWTSWYHFYNNISAPKILENLETISQSELPFDTFQIDDGWQTATGDWFSVKPSFPDGMGSVASKIKAAGLKPGLWLAPFIASAKSELVRKHPEWILRDKKGKPIKAGWNPYWGGWYFALDFYNAGFRDYLSGVFHTILDKWGYEVLKLDFLFAVCLNPPGGKTRGGVMWEAMEFLRMLSGDRQILACGAPLGSCFGHVDFCRIGADTHLKWEHKLLKLLRHRERVSSISALRSVLGRWQLNQRAFLNDPDVFILRKENQHLSPDQQNTLLTVNALLGGVLFTSDNVGAYSAEEQAELEAALELRNSQIRLIREIYPDVFRIDFEQNGVRYYAVCNLSNQKCNVDKTIELQAFETLVLKD